MDTKRKEILAEIANYTGMAAVQTSKTEEGYRLEYVSDTVRQFGMIPDQLVQQNIALEDVICPGDLEQIRQRMEDAIQYRIPQLTLECRIITGEQELVQARLFVYNYYDDKGRPSGFDLLIQERREHMQLNSEREYLSNVISKMKSVLIVKTYYAGKRRLNYISSNAGILGLNAEALKKGYKLTEDYIYPEDRGDVIDSVYQAVADGVADFKLNYRMVRDDGTRIWVENDVTINRLSDKEAELSFLVTDITEQKNVERELEELTKQNSDRPDPAEEPTLRPLEVDVHDAGLIKLFESLAENVCIYEAYYGVLLDKEGKLVSTPVGPSQHIGQFYDIPERIEFKEQFKQISTRVEDSHIPQSASYKIDDMDISMEFIPLILKDRVIAYWMLTSFEENGAELLASKINTHWRITNTIVNYFYSEHVIRNERKCRILAERQYHRAKQEQGIIKEMINIMTQDGENGLDEMFQKAAAYLSLSDLGIYLENKDTKNVESYFVRNRFGKETDFPDKLRLTVSEYKTLTQLFEEREELVIDRKTEQPFLRELIRRTDVENMVLMPVVSRSGQKGYIVYARSTRDRYFDEKEISFMEIVRHIFVAVHMDKNHRHSKGILREGMLEAYNYLQEAVLVKDNQTEEIIFANKAADGLFGYSLVGMPIAEILTDQTEQYRHMHGMGKRIIANKKTAKWQSYMKELDQIMNIVEIQIGAKEKKGYSLFILTNKEK